LGIALNVNPPLGSTAEARYARLTSRRTALVLGALIALLTAGAVPLTIVSDSIGGGLIIVPFAAVGWIVARRQARNPIGWILLLLSLVFLVAADSGQYAVLAYHQGYRGLPFPRIGVFLAATWIWLIMLLPLPITLFPDGRLSRRWRLVVMAYLAACTIWVASATWQDATGIAAQHIRIDSSGELVSVGDSPGGWLVGPFAIVYIAFCLASVARQLVSYRRSTGELRQQLKWLLSGGAIAVVGLVLTLALSNAHSELLRDVGSHTFAGLLALPIGLAVGILKYRLYDIDRLISRTVSYAIITGLLVGVYFVIVTLATRVLPFSSPVGVAASTLAAAALFNPLRTRVQHGVDRRFNRARFDADAIVAAFGAQLRDAIDLDSVQTRLVDAVERTLAPDHASLWIRSRAHER
jgi:hypothetical protein